METVFTVVKERNDKLSYPNMHKDDSLSTSSVEDPQNKCKSILNDILPRLSLGLISIPSSIVTLFVPNRNLLSMALALPLPPFAGPLHVDLC